MRTSGAVLPPRRVPRPRQGAKARGAEAAAKMRIAGRLRTRNRFATMHDMTEKIYVAADFGAGSGRVIAGRFDGSRLRFEETNRFENTQTPLPGGLYWDMVALYRNLLEGIRRARALGSEPVSVGVDTWGVDYVLVDAAGRLAGLPHSYRDPRLDGVMDETCTRLGRRRISVIFPSCSIPAPLSGSGHPVIAFRIP